MALLIAGVVLIDSSQEEQYSRYVAISPAIAERYATQATSVSPVSHTRSSTDVNSGCKSRKRTLASRSKYGKLVETNSGLVVAVEQPDIVVDSIRDKTVKTGRFRR